MNVCEAVYVCMAKWQTDQNKEKAKEMRLGNIYDK